MLNIKCDINQQYLKTVDLILSNLNNFYSLEVVDRVSETNEMNRALGHLCAHIG